MAEGYHGYPYLTDSVLTLAFIAADSGTSNRYTQPDIKYQHNIEYQHTSRHK